MKDSKELKLLRSSKIEGQQSLIDAAVEEKREMTEEEASNFDTLQSEIEDLDGKIKRAETIEARKASEAAAGSETQDDQSDQEKRDLSKFSFGKVIRSLATSNGKLDGIEAEMHQEAEKEAREKGVQVVGVGIPSMLYRLDSHKEIEQRTTLTAGVAATAGNLIATELGDLIPALRPQLQVVAAGAQVLNGLVGNMDMPRQNAVSSATWEGETDNAAETNPTFEKISLSPKRLAAYTDVSLQMLNQGSLDVERLIINDLTIAIQTALDSAAINGSGSGDIPEGILNTTGIGDVAMGTNGGNITWAKIVELITNIENNDAFVFGDPTYLGTPGLRGYMLSNEKFSSTGQTLMMDRNTLNGLPALFSTQVPSTLTKGTSTDCHALIAGAWNQMVVGSWGVLDLTVDNITKKKAGQIEVVVNSFHDFAVRQPKAFAAIKDARV